MKLRISNTKQDDAVILKPVNLKTFDAFKKDCDPFLANQLISQPFNAGFGEMAFLLNKEGGPDCVLVGMESPPADPRASVISFASLATRLPGQYEYYVNEKEWPGVNWTQAATGWGMGSYNFNRYLSNGEAQEKQAPGLVVPEGVDISFVNDQVEAVFMARDLINTPANDLGPQDLCDKVNEIAEAHGAEISIIEGEDLVAENYPAIYEVGKGSTRPPALIDLHWGDPTHTKLTLVGKGVVYDSGGLSLKPSARMLSMKKDMGGSAITLALANLIMSRKLPVRLRLLIPTVENAIGNASYRPGDIIKTRKNISVEVGNTDAEGRLILSDALTEAVSEDPDLIIDMATLTGAARTALGQDLPAFWTPSDKLAAELDKAAGQAADPVWRLPLWQPYRSNLKSSVADINNMANTPMGGSITAALFLHEFVRPFNNWIHMDVYGWRVDNLPGSPKGGEASALRAVYRFLENRYKP